MKRILVITITLLLSMGCLHKKSDIKRIENAGKSLAEAAEQAALQDLKVQLDAILFPGQIVTPLNNLTDEELMELAEKTKANTKVSDLSAAIEGLDPAGDKFYYANTSAGESAADTLDNIMAALTTLGMKSIELPAYAHFTNADALYDDNAGGTPYGLIDAECKNAIITNYGETVDSVYTSPAYSFGMNFMVQVGAAYQMDLEPPAGGFITLNGTAAAADEHIINAADTEGDVMSCYSVESANGAYKLFCNSANTNFAEATPP